MCLELNRNWHLESVGFFIPKAVKFRFFWRVEPAEEKLWKDEWGKAGAEGLSPWPPEAAPAGLM